MYVFPSRPRLRCQREPARRSPSPASHASRRTRGGVVVVRVCSVIAFLPATIANTIAHTPRRSRAPPESARACCSGRTRASDAMAGARYTRIRASRLRIVVRKTARLVLHLCFALGRNGPLRPLLACPSVGTQPLRTRHLSFAGGLLAYSQENRTPMALPCDTTAGFPRPALCSRSTEDDLPRLRSSFYSAA